MIWHGGAVLYGAHEGKIDSTETSNSDTKFT